MFQFLIGTLQTQKAVFEEVLIAVSIPYRYSSNPHLFIEGAFLADSVSIPYRYSSNDALCVDSFYPLEGVSIPYRYSSNEDDDFCHLCEDEGVSIPYRYSSNLFARPDGRKEEIGFNSL